MCERHTDSCLHVLYHQPPPWLGGETSRNLGLGLVLHTLPPAPNNSGLVTLDGSAPAKAVPKPGTAKTLGMVARGPDSIEDQESAMPMFKVCDALLRMLLAELTREWPRLYTFAGEPNVPVGRPAGNCEDAGDCCASPHKLDIDCSELRAVALLGVRTTGGVVRAPAPEPIGFCFAW